MKYSYKLTLLVIVISLLLFACTSQPKVADPSVSIETTTEPAQTVDVEFTLKTIADNGKLLYIGVGGKIDGIVNPDLVVHPGGVVRVTLINGDGMTHNLFIPDLNVKTEYVNKIGDSEEIIFEVGDLKPGDHVYYCTLPGHRKAGQEGRLIVESSKQ